MPIASELLAILACPKCKSDIHPADQGEGLVCDSCRVVYPIREDIPIMLIDEAVPQDKWEAGERHVKPQA